MAFKGPWQSTLCCEAMKAARRDARGTNNALDILGDVVFLAKCQKPANHGGSLGDRRCVLQACLRSSCSSDSLRGQLGRLAAACLAPPVAAVSAAALDAAHVALSWLESVERLLAGAGMDPHASGKGPCPAA